MGKDKAAKRSRGSLVQDIAQSDAIKRKNRPSKQRSRQSDNVDQYVGDKLSRKILDQALEQQDELEAEYGASMATKGKKSLSEARTSLSGLPTSTTAGSDVETDSDEDQLPDEDDQYYEDVVCRP